MKAGRFPIAGYGISTRLLPEDAKVLDVIDNHGTLTLVYTYRNKDYIRHREFLVADENTDIPPNAKYVGKAEVDEYWLLVFEVT